MSKTIIDIMYCKKKEDMKIIRKNKAINKEG